MSEDRVIEFKRRGCATAKPIDTEGPEPKIWKCWHCDGLTFELRGDGTIWCPRCNIVQSLRNFDPQDNPL